MAATRMEICSIIMQFYGIFHGTEKECDTEKGGKIKALISKDCFDVFSSCRNGEMCIVQPIFIFTLGMIGFH